MLWLTDVFMCCTILQPISLQPPPALTPNKRRANAQVQALALQQQQLAQAQTVVDQQNQILALENEVKVHIFIILYY